MKKKISNKSGYTFLEVMIAFSIFGILILVVYTTFFNEIIRFNDRISQINMNIESARAMRTIKKTVDEYDEILILNNNLVSSNGVIIIDALDNGNLEGSQLNLDYDSHNLIDNQGNIIANNIESIQFVLGPAVYNDIDVLEHVLLIIINMKSKRGSFVLKGGLNIEK